MGTLSGSEIKKKIEGWGISLTMVANNLAMTPQHLNSKLNADDIKVGFLVELSNAINKSVDELIADVTDKDGVKYKDKAEWYNKTLIEVQIKNKRELDNLQNMVETQKDLISMQKEKIKALELQLEQQSKSIKQLNPATT